jgi:predicted RecB family nuclease
VVDGAAPLLGPLAASRCALRVRFDAPGGAPAGVTPASESEVSRFRTAEAQTFQRTIAAEVHAAHPGALDLSVDPEAPGTESGTEPRIRRTLAALDAGVEVIVGGALPDDPAGRRHGRPDVLVRAGRRADGRWGYRPVLVANHRTLDARRAVTLAHLDDPEVAVLPMPMLAPADLEQLDLPPEQPSRRDRLALAHLWRLLEAVGHEADRPLAAVIGSERVAAWTDLAERGVLDAYDAAFAHRLEVVDAPEPWPVPPVRVHECDRCRWQQHCAAELVRVDSTSLVPGIGVAQWQALRSVGVDTRAELAALPDDLDGDDPRLTAIDEQVGLDWLPTAIDQAWVATTGGGHAHLRRDAGALRLPEADVEVDLDMENALDGSVYLWGVLVDGQYRPAYDWGEPGEQLSARVFTAFWEQVTELTERAWHDGKRLAFYVWHEQAEIGAMALGARAAAAAADGVDRRDRVEALVSPPPDELDPTDPLVALRAAHFVDLLQVYRGRCLHGSGYGLKVVAPKAGFRWDDEDPSGSESMLWHRSATTEPAAGAPDPRAAMRARLLRYNEDDVRATAAVRSWLRTARLPRVGAAPLSLRPGPERSGWP